MPPRRRYIKLFPEITEHPVFGNPAALQVFIYLLTRADWQTGIVSTPARQIARDCGKVTDSANHILKRLQFLESVGSVQITTRNPLTIQVTNWKKWQSSEINKCSQNATECSQNATECSQNATECSQNATECSQNATECSQNATECSQNATECSQNATPPYPRARYKNNKNLRSEEYIYIEKQSSQTSANNYGYPETAEAVIAEAERQCLKMTTQQAQDFLDYYRSIDWMPKGSKIPPNGWQFKIRRWLDNAKQYDAQQSQRAAAINPNAIGSNGQFRAGYRIAGVEPPTEDFQ